MGEYVSVIICRVCNSRHVEISEWSEQGKAFIHCRTCGAREEIGKFTLGRCQVSHKELQNARDTMAHKNRIER